MKNTDYDDFSRRPRRTARSKGSEERLSEMRARSERYKASYEDDYIDVPGHTGRRISGSRYDESYDGRYGDDSSGRRRNTNRSVNNAYRSSAVNRNLADLEQEAFENERFYGKRSSEKAYDGRAGIGKERSSARGGNSGSPSGIHARRGKSPVKRVIATLLICVLVLVGGFFAWSQIKNLMKPKYWTVAVFGVDSRDGNLGAGALSDVIMVASINRRTGDVNLTSVYRDSYLQIDDEGNYHKINEAYFKGGYEQAIAALERNLQLSIDDYVTFNWKAVAEGITMLGGIDLDISDSEFKYINAFITETVNSTGLGSVQLEHSGMNHLDGVQAVAYGRLRLMDTDFNRTARQRKVLQLAMEKAKTADKKTLAATAMTVMSEVKTSIGLDDVMDMAKNVKNYNIQNAVGFPFSRDTTLVGRMDVVVPATLASNVLQLHPFLYGDDAANFSLNDTVKKISAHIQEKTGIGELQNADIPKIGGGTGITRASDETAAADTKKETETKAAETKTEETKSQETTEAETTAKAETEAETSETIEEIETETESETKKEEETKKETKESKEETKETRETDPEKNSSDKPGNSDQQHDDAPSHPGDSSGPSDGPSAGPGGLTEGDTSGPSAGPGAA
ncbi:cell envelope-related function transcriptional attenuator [Lachnospiraceae bacterium JC7]|nr:cell envelope-related function transcriptional attenuator [Lachnospiraceae bacterium JC7]